MLELHVSSQVTEVKDLCVNHHSQMQRSIQLQQLITKLFSASLISMRLAGVIFKLPSNPSRHLVLFLSILGTQ
jgi:hypothetical protein